MNRPLRSSVRAATPFAALVLLTALAVSLAPAPRSAGDATAATTRREGSLDAVLAELPYGPPDPDDPARPRRGALVLEVDPGGAGDRQGLREGDIIVEFEGQPVRTAYELAGAIRREGEGSLVSIHVWRNGRREWLGLATLSGRTPRLDLEQELAALREETAALRDEVAGLTEDVARLRDEVARLRPRRTPARTAPE